MTGAHRRVGTTYVQLVAALAAANRYGTYISILLLLSIAKAMLYSVVFQGPSPDANFTFLSRIHSNLLVDGLSTQSGWGHVWNRYAGPLSCPCQPHQCALTPLLPHAWWDGQWQSPISREVRRLLDYGVRLSNTGEVDVKERSWQKVSSSSTIQESHKTVGGQKKIYTGETPEPEVYL